MKLLKKVLGVLTIVLSAAALVLFFANFGKVIFDNGDEVVRTGTQFAFGSSFEGSKTGLSSKILFCLILTALTVLFSSLSIKFKGSRWATIVVSLIDSIFMLVVACRNSDYYLDMQGYPGAYITKYVNHTPLFIALLLFATLASSVAYLLIADRLAVAGVKGQLTIPQKVAKALRDYKGEIMKIVWPGPRSVVKNTLIVLAVCLLVGAFIWLLDWGLGSLVKWIIESTSK